MRHFEWFSNIVESIHIAKEVILNLFNDGKIDVAKYGKEPRKSWKIRFRILLAWNGHKKADSINCAITVIAPKYLHRKLHIWIGNFKKKGKTAIFIALMGLFHLSFSFKIWRMLSFPSFPDICFHVNNNVKTAAECFSWPKSAANLFPEATQNETWEKSQSFQCKTTVPRFSVKITFQSLFCVNTDGFTQIP